MSINPVGGQSPSFKSQEAKSLPPPKTSQAAFLMQAINAYNDGNKSKAIDQLNSLLKTLGPEGTLPNIARNDISQAIDYINKGKDPSSLLNEAYTFLNK